MTRSNYCKIFHQRTRLRPTRGSKVRHIQHKNDWFYEFRPQLIALFGLAGLLNFGSSSNIIYVGQACGLVLLASAYKIHSWRQAYRKNLL